jgi:hypothetical protein
VRAAALAALLLASVAAAEISLMIRKDAVEAHKQEVDARWKSIDEAARRIKSQTEQIEQRKKALAQQKADQTRLEAMLNFYSHAIPERGELVRSVLGVLQEAVTDEVIIVSINETAKSANAKMMPPPPALPDVMKDKRIEVENFNIEAWAISEAAAQSFIQKMKEKVAPWHLEVRDAQVSSHTGPLNLDGFAVLMRLVRLIEADAAAPVQQKAGAK